MSVCLCGKNKQCTLYIRTRKHHTNTQPPLYSSRYCVRVCVRTCTHALMHTCIHARARAQYIRISGIKEFEALDKESMGLERFQFCKVCLVLCSLYKTYIYIYIYMICMYICSCTNL